MKSPETIALEPHVPDTSFVPGNLNAARWENLQPLYQALLDRDLHCQNCLERLILDRSELDAAANEAFNSLYITYTCHTDNTDAKKAYLDFVEHVEPKLKTIGFELDKRTVNSPHAPKLDQQRYGVMLRDLRADVELFRPENVDLQTQESKLTQQYEELCGAMTVQFRGQERTLPQMALFQEDTDRATREEAWRLTAKRRLQDRETIDTLFDQLVKLRHQMALNAGCANYIEYAFRRKHRFDYTPQDCLDFHRGAAEVCQPLQRDLNAARAKALNVNSLRPWDLAVDVKGRAPLRPFKSAVDLIDGTSKLFHKLDPLLGKLFDTLRTPDALDLETRKGKAPGGYQSSRDRQRRAFIFMNAAGLHKDLQTMIHEAGHAFHSMLAKHDPLLHYRSSPLEFAEVASMGMELLAQPHLDVFYAPAEADRARRQHLESVVTILPWIATIDAFQHWIYMNPNHTRTERTAEWLRLDERFGPAVNWSGLEDIRASLWHRQLHPFCVPLYYIEYGIALLGSLQLWKHSRKDVRAALERYRKALALGGSRPLPDLFKAAELEFKFGPQTMRGLIDEVRGELSRLPL